MQLIYGKAGTGKSTYIFNEIKETIKNCEKIYIITPEQFSFNAEKKLLETLEEKSTLKAEVLTFKRMAHRVMEEVGGITETHLSLCGRFMLLHSIISKNLKNLTYLNNQEGNIDLISTTITELKKHEISVEDIKNAIEKTTNESMKIKLTDIYFSYKAYEENIKNKYIDEDDILGILNEKITESTLFKNLIIYIDEFVGFTKQEYNIIEKLFSIAKDVKITVCTDELEITKSQEQDIFYESKKTAENLINAAKKAKTIVEKPIELMETYRFKNETLKHLEGRLSNSIKIKEKSESRTVGGINHSDARLSLDPRSPSTSQEESLIPPTVRLSDFSTLLNFRSPKHIHRSRKYSKTN